MIRRPPSSPLFPYTPLFRSLYTWSADLLYSMVLPAWKATMPAKTFITCRMNVFAGIVAFQARSEEHTSELQSHLNLVCRLLLEKKKKTSYCSSYSHDNANIH